MKGAPVRGLALLLTLVPAMLLALSLTGCAGSAAAPERFVPDGHLLMEAAAGTARDFAAAEPLAEIAPEEPLVKVLQGTALDARAAGALLAGEAEAPPVAVLDRRVNLLQLRETPLEQVVFLLNALCEANLVVTPEAARRVVSIELRRVSLRAAIEAICRLQDLWYRERGGIVTLMTSAEYAREVVVHRHDYSRAFTLRYTNATDLARLLQAVMGGQVLFADIGSEQVYGHVLAEGAAGGGGGAATAVGTAILEEADKQHQAVLQALGDGLADELQLAERLGKKASAVVTVFKRNNMILARSLDERVLDEIGRLLATLDTPTNQVLLEISILQVTLNDGYESFFKIDFPGNSKLSLGSLPSSTGSGDSTLAVLMGNANIQARMRFFAEENRMNVLATPYLMSANNSTVEFFVGEETPLRDDVTSKTLYDDEGNPTTTLYEMTINREELGTDLEISSFINDDGTITMDFNAEISTPNLGVTEITVVDENTGTAQSFPLDGVNKSELTSMITAAPGETLAIGGIIREQLEKTENKVPLLGDLPYLGLLFKELADTKTKTETVILLTPHLIRHPRQATEVSREFLDRRSSHPRFERQQENLLNYPVRGAAGAAVP